MQRPSRRTARRCSCFAPFPGTLVADRMRWCKFEQAEQREANGQHERQFDAENEWARPGGRIFQEVSSHCHRAQADRSEEREAENEHRAGAQRMREISRAYACQT